MPNFCSNCGAKIKGKFCSSCGQSVKDPSGLVGYWQAKHIDTSEGQASRKGVITLSKTELIFHYYGFFSGKAKERYRIPIKQIKSIIRTSLLNWTTIKFNKASEESSGFKKFFNKRTIVFKISDWQSFIQNIQILNSNIKIKV